MAFDHQRKRQQLMKTSHQPSNLMMYVFSPPFLTARLYPSVSEYKLKRDDLSNTSSINLNDQVFPHFFIRSLIHFMHFALESKIRLKASHQRADTRTTFVCFKKRNIATGEKAIALWAEITHPPLNSHFSTWSGMVPGFINSCSRLIHNNEKCPTARQWTF